MTHTFPELRCRSDKAHEFRMNTALFSAAVALYLRGLGFAEKLDKPFRIAFGTGSQNRFGILAIFFSNAWSS